MSSKDATRTDSNALKRIESFQYPNAHYNHLTEEQAAKLAQFKQLCQEKGYYRPITSDHPRASHDDETLLRYLRARKFLPADAFKQFKDTENWRKDNEIDTLYDTIDVAEFDETRLLYPQWTGRRDKRGIPLYVFEIAGLNNKRMTEYQNSLSSKANPAKGNISPNLRRLFALYENLIQFTMPLCSALPDRPYPNTPVSQSNNIVDISKTGLKQFWNLKGHMQEASTLATAHYPETLDRIFILGAPSFFPTVWSWIKRWFDPITVSKIFILTPATQYQVLSEYIDPEDIPVKYGGKLEWQWGQLPNLDRDISSSLEWINPAKGENGANVFPVGPIRWRPNKDETKITAVALGTVDGKQREEEIAHITLPKDEVMNRLASRPQVNRLHSTTGDHTHPPAYVEAFPKSGDTPIDTPVGSDAQSMSSSAKLGDKANRSDEISQTDFSSKFGLQGQQSPHSAEERANQTRQGTSSMRQDFQAGTHAEGSQSHATPAVVDHGNLDKTKTVEPGTIGQAPKDITVPEKADEQEGTQESYVDQAKEMANSTIATVESVAAGLASKVGLGGKSEEESKKEQEERERQEAKQKQDPEVDKLGDVEVEDFIRAKYATHQNPSAKAKAAPDA